METVKMDRFAKHIQTDHNGHACSITDLQDRTGFNPYGKVLVTISTRNSELNEIILDLLFRELNTNKEWLELLNNPTNNED